MKHCKFLMVTLIFGLIFFINLNPVYSYTSTDVNTLSSQINPISMYTSTNTEEELTFEEAMEILGITDTSKFNGNVIKLENGNSRSMPDVLEAGNVYYEDMTITKTVTGRGRKYNGNQFCWGIAIGEGSKNLGIGTYSYDSNWIYNGVRFVELVRPGYKYTSGFMNITWGQYYYLKYIPTDYGGPDNTASISFRIVIGVN